MTLDQRLVGIWDVSSANDQGRCEITPSGLYLAHSITTPYTISPDGLTLTVQAPGETYSMQRVGQAASSLLGSWSRTHAEGDVETITYLDDGTRVTDWDGLYVGFYEDLGDAIKYIEVRGQVSTDGSRYSHSYSGVLWEWRYEVVSETTFRHHDLGSDEVVNTFVRVQS